jgi:hypothetical protein
MRKEYLAQLCTEVKQNHPRLKTEAAYCPHVTHNTTVNWMKLTQNINKVLVRVQCCGWYYHGSCDREESPQVCERRVRKPCPPGEGLIRLLLCKLA